MKDWNVLVTLSVPSTPQAIENLSEWGTTEPTRFSNVLVMRVADPVCFLARLAQAHDGVSSVVAHAVPAQHSFDFDDVQAFETEARSVAFGWVSALKGKSFHVRLHRRGLKGALSTPEEERFLDEMLLNALAAAGNPGRISFEDPDAVIQIETVDHRAGMSLWTREDIRRYPFLGLKVGHREEPKIDS